VTLGLRIRLALAIEHTPDIVSVIASQAINLLQLKLVRSVPGSGRSESIIVADNKPAQNVFIASKAFWQVPDTLYI